MKTGLFNLSLISPPQIKDLKMKTGSMTTIKKNIEIVLFLRVNGVIKTLKAYIMD